jgi:hypothetical protein
LALVGRDEPRDYLDIHEAMELLPLGALFFARAAVIDGDSALLYFSAAILST